MVFATCILHASKRAMRRYLRPIFIDSLRVHVKAGSGGAGIQKYGGRGGQGGNVYLVAREKLFLEKLQSALKTRRIKATSGEDSTSRGIIGAPGENVIVEVPVGITVKTADGAILGDLNKDGDELLVANGGLGGCEETQYFGTKGQVRNLILDLKLIADVGLVGFPNAGKSTLLAAVSRAKPKIAEYPFTTVKPQIGVLRYRDGRELSIADLPGLMEGAHNNTGKGFKFLKHIERTKLLLFVIDIQGFQYSSQHHRRSCLETVLLLNKELELYKSELVSRPAVMLVNKMDTENANQIFEEIRPKLMNLAEAASEVEEESRPEQFIQFDEILTASLISRNKEEIIRIRERIREVIDKAEERKQLQLEKEMPEERLKRKLERFTDKHTPVLV